ncbi:MAG: HPr kinase/phosphatase C-terminal domain-containing protein [Sphingomonadales bacterium]|nr:HPr kinase/phosphatase C-terminal domain-containing protein [Sphingomonadales bacterium]
MTMLYHASCVQLEGGAVLLAGPSGAGKSDLALRLIHEGGRLVGDDYVHLELVGGRLMASAPAAIRGKIEVRGVGIIDAPSVERAEVRCLISLAPARDAVERLPEPARLELAGVALPVFTLYPFEPSAAAKVAAALALCDNPGRT